MNRDIRPIYTANKLYVKSGTVSIESQIGSEMYQLPIIWDESAKDSDSGFFKVFSTNNDMWSYINGTPLLKRNFHEVIFGRNPQRLRFDLDAKDHLKQLIDEYNLDLLPPQYRDDISNLANQNHNIIIRYIRDVIFDLFVESYNDDIHDSYPGYAIDKEKIMFVTESHSPEKYSFHIIITKFTVKDNQEAAWFMKRVIKYLKENQPLLVDLIDQQTYTSTQFFRILGCGKRNDPERIKKISKLNMNVRKNLNKGLIQQNNTGDDLPISILHYTDTVPIWQIMNNGNDTYNISKETERICQEVVYDNFQDDYIFKHTKGNLMEYQRRYPSYCKICKRRHEQENAYAYMSGGTLYWNCRRNTNKEKILALKTVEESSFDRVQQLLRTKDEITQADSDEMNDLRRYKEVSDYVFDEYNRKEIKDFPKDYDTLYVKAPMKMGKTKQLIKHVKSIKDDVQSILVVSFRRAFTEEFLSKFNDKTRGLVRVFDKELEDYKKINGAERRITSDIHPFVIVQVESFHRVVSSYDTVILDESESIYEQFSSTNVKNLTQIIHNFSRVISKAKRVICMDAYMGTRTVEITNMLRGNHKKNIKFTINTFKNQGIKSETGLYTYHIGYCKTEFYDRIKESLQNGERIVFMSNTRDKLSAYEKLINRDFPNCNVQSYTALSREEEKKELKDVNRSWLQYHVVMYSPTITAGISFEQKHFDKVFCFFSNMSCSVLSCMQMMGRVRDVKDREIVICLENHYHRCSVTKEGIEEDLIENRNELLSIPFNGRSIFPDHDEVDEYFNYKPYKDEYYQIWLYNQLSNNISKKFFARYLIYCIHTTGAKIEIYDSKEGNGSKDLLNAQKEVVEERYMEIAHVSMLQREELDQIYEKSERESLTIEEERALQKVRLKNTYNITNNRVLYDIDFIKTYYPSKSRYIYHNLKEILSFERMEDAIRDATEYECTQIKRFNTEQDSKSDLNHPVKSILHYSCFQVLYKCGFPHILSKSLIPKSTLAKNFTESLPDLQKALKLHGLKPARLGTDKATKKLEKNDQYFKMSLVGTNSLLKKFYGINITKNCSIILEEEEEKYGIQHCHNFLIIEDNLSEQEARDEQPFIFYRGYKVNSKFKPKRFKPEEDIDVESDIEEDEFNIELDSTDSESEHF